MPTEWITDPVTGAQGPVAVRTLGASGHEPVFLLVGDRQATPADRAGHYRADADKFFAQFQVALPSGTFARLVVDYLREYRADGARRVDDPDRLDLALRDVICAIGDGFAEHPGRRRRSVAELAGNGDPA